MSVIRWKLGSVAAAGYFARDPWLEKLLHSLPQQLPISWVDILKRPRHIVVLRYVAPQTPNRKRCVLHQLRLHLQRESMFEG